MQSNIQFCGFGNSTFIQFNQILGEIYVSFELGESAQIYQLSYCMGIEYPLYFDALLDIDALKNTLFTDPVLHYTVSTKLSYLSIQTPKENPIKDFFYFQKRKEISNIYTNFVSLDR